MVWPHCVSFFQAVPLAERGVARWLAYRLSTKSAGASWNTTINCGRLALGTGMDWTGPSPSQPLVFQGVVTERELS